MRLGSDPEVFLFDGQGLRSAIGLIGAGKLDPFQIPDMPAGFTLQEDNVTLEYGIPPASSAEELYNSISAVMRKSLEYTKGLSFSGLSCAVFPAEEMQDPAAHVFGCEPDFNAWTNDVNPGPSVPHPFMRSAGGHIHVETQEHPLRVVRAMDLFLGVPSVLMDAGGDRRKLYGKAGAHRVKSYGVEYRTLSNFWIAPNDAALRKRLCQWVWNGTAEALTHLDWADEYAAEIQQAINGNDKQMAQDLVTYLKLETV